MGAGVCNHPQYIIDVSPHFLKQIPWFYQTHANRPPHPKCRSSPALQPPHHVGKSEWGRPFLRLTMSKHPERVTGWWFHPIPKILDVHIIPKIWKKTFSKPSTRWYVGSFCQHDMNDDEIFHHILNVVSFPKMHGSNPWHSTRALFGGLCAGPK